jgi:putative transposase
VSGPPLSTLVHIAYVDFEDGPGFPISSRGIATGQTTEVCPYELVSRFHNERGGRPATTYDPERHGRRSIRLKGYDYAQPGSYFVTLCVQDRECLFGDIQDGKVRLNVAGLVVDSWWGGISRRFPGAVLDAHVVMPNHLHGLLLLERGDEREDIRTDTSIGKIVQWFKSASATDYRRGVLQDGWEPYRGRLWQRNYYEHIVRNEYDLERIRTYIDANPVRWHEDAENPMRCLNPS